LDSFGLSDPLLTVIVVFLVLLTLGASEMELPFVASVFGGLFVVESVTGIPFPVGVVDAADLGSALGESFESDGKGPGKLSDVTRNHP
jgi:hypothetical protein